MIYSGAKTSAISFPLGGIGSGCIGLGGNGRLIDWEIFNRPAKNSYNEYSHFAVRAEKDGKVVDARILNGDLQPHYMGTHQDSFNYSGFGWGAERQTLCGLPHFREHTFDGRYPVAEINFEEEKFPGKASMCAWSPLIPGNDTDSSIPVACFEIEIVNNQKEKLDYSVVGALSNPFGGVTASNDFEALEKGGQLVLRSGGEEAGLEYGDLCLSTQEENISFQQYWFRGGWVDYLEVYMNDLFKAGKFSNRVYENRDEGNTRKDTGLLAAHFSLQPGESRKVKFAITWNIPNRKNDWNAKADEMAEEHGLKNQWKNWYATQWKDSTESGKYVLDNYDRLREGTFLFRDTLFSSTLPQSVVERVSANISILKSPTCLRLEDGTFYGWEGVGTTKGSCEGSCTHVWNYTQALPFLFPSLERSMRSAHYANSVDENGGCHFRMMLPLGIKADTGFVRPCVDGQFGDVMKAYRDWKISGDNEWLKGLWPVIKKSIEYAWSDKNYDLWDPEQSGVITGRQHHTLDMELFGPSAWLNGHYLGALKAAAEMAEFCGEAEFASTCREIFAKGKKWTDENLFNGEYYFHKVNLEDKSQLEKFTDHGCAAEIYWNDEHGEIKYQVGDGCQIDMTLPQWYASLYGLGEVLDSEKTRKTLEAIFKNNFICYRDSVNTWRIYGLNGEKGLQICSWPEDKRKPVIPLPYASETMHGFEWAAACNMLMNGLYEEGMAVVESIYDRYDGQKRNPWNEFECGSNYARSMASYGLLNAFSGFSFDMTEHRIGFKPLKAEKEFRCFWSLGSAWGEYVSSSEAQKVTVKYGELELKMLEVPGMAKEVKLSSGEKPEAEYSEGYIKFKNTISLNAGSEITVAC